MTLLVAGICKQDGEPAVVIASDRMISVMQPNIEYEGPMTKSYQITESCIMLTAGSALEGLPLHREIKKHVDDMGLKSVLEIVSIVKRAYQEIRKSRINDGICQRFCLSFEDFLERQGEMAPSVVQAIYEQMSTFDLTLEILIAGVDNDGAHIYRISNPGIELCFDPIGFHAVGSGEEHAVANLIARGHNVETPLEEGLVNITEAKKVGEKASGVGEMTDIFIILSGKTYGLTNEQIKGLVKLSELRQKGRLEEYREGLMEFWEDFKSNVIHKKQ